MRTQPVTSLVVMTRERPAGIRGMTLIEVMVAIAVFSLTILWAIQAILGTVAYNRALMASMTGELALRAQAEELYGVAMDVVATNSSASSGEPTFAERVIRYYGTGVAVPNSTAAADVLPIGPNGSDISRVIFDPAGTLTYQFALPAPGEGLRAISSNSPDGNSVPKGGIIPYVRGMGRMVLYLDEALLPDNLSDLDASAGGPLWVPLGTNTTNDNVSVAPATGPFNPSVLSDPESVGFKRVFADITVTYFSDNAQAKVISNITRRVVINGALSDLFVLSGVSAD